VEGSEFILCVADFGSGCKSRILEIFGNRIESEKPEEIDVYIAKKERWI
jgi:hypothetical protein